MRAWYRVRICPVFLRRFTFYLLHRKHQDRSRAGARPRGEEAGRGRGLQAVPVGRDRRRAEGGAEAAGLRPADLLHLLARQQSALRRRHDAAAADRSGRLAAAAQPSHRIRHHFGVERAMDVRGLARLRQGRRAQGASADRAGRCRQLCGDDGEGFDRHHRPAPDQGKAPAGAHHHHRERRQHADPEILRHHQEGSWSRGAAPTCTSSARCRKIPMPSTSSS